MMYYTFIDPFRKYVFHALSQQDLFDAVEELSVLACLPLVEADCHGDRMCFRQLTTTQVSQLTSLGYCIPEC